MSTHFEDDVSPSRDFSKASLSKSNSDPDLLIEDGEVLLRKKSMSGRSQRKLKTYHAPSSLSRWDDVQLPAKALAELHEKHETWKATVAMIGEDTSNAALEASFTRNAGCWLAFGNPASDKEKPFNVRNFKCYPGSALKAFRRWDGGLLNTKGQKGLTDRSIGQDNCSAALIADGWEVYCVMDGHGPNGEWPSTRAVRTIPFFLQTTGCATMLKQGQVEAALTGCFKKAQADLEDAAFKENFDMQVTGCTAVVCCYQPKRATIWIATAGDSRAVLLEPGKGCVKSTTDHKPSVEAERKRIESFGGEIVTTKYDDGWVEQRVNLKGKDFPGISMSRCFGDLLVKDIGVVAEPTVEEWALSSYKNPYLFAATDGVWEFLENDVVADILLSALERGSTPIQACEELLRDAQKAWKEHEGTYCDDISMILKPLNTGAPTFAISSDLCCGGVQKSCTIL